MAVSKRLRFEILRRDNHQCRYCGRCAPEVKLTVDHVVPETLGGSDDPGNLVAACADCNGGKSSVPADAPLVADVAADAMRWAAAMRQVFQERAAARGQAQKYYKAFSKKWEGWTYEYAGEKCTVSRPDNWRLSIDQLLAAGLEIEDLVELVDVAMSARAKDTWRYWCGCCWKRLIAMQERAAEIVTATARPDLVTTRLTRAEFKNNLRWITGQIVDQHNVPEDVLIDLNMHSCVHENNLADCEDLVCTYIALAELAVGLSAPQSVNSEGGTL